VRLGLRAGQVVALGVQYQVLVVACHETTQKWQAWLRKPMSLMASLQVACQC